MYDDAIEDEKPNIELVTKDGVYYAQFSTESGSNLDIHEVDAEDVELFSEWGVNVRLLVSDYLNGEGVVDFEHCDAAFKQWLFSPEPRYEEGRVVGMLGGYLGQRCIDDLGMRWVRVEDEKGVEYAVMHEGASVISYPFACVRKRISRCEYDFLAGVFHTVKHAISSSGLDMRSVGDKKIS